MALHIRVGGFRKTRQEMEQLWMAECSREKEDHKSRAGIGEDMREARQGGTK